MSGWLVEPAAAAGGSPDPTWVKLIIGPYGALALLLLVGILIYRGGLRVGHGVDEMREHYKTQLAEAKTECAELRADYEQRLAEARREADWWRRVAVDALGAGEKLAASRRATTEDDGYAR